MDSIHTGLPKYSTSISLGDEIICFARSTFIVTSPFDFFLIVWADQPGIYYRVNYGHQEGFNDKMELLEFFKDT